MNPDLDLKNWLENVSSPDFFEAYDSIMMATINAVMQEDRVLWP